MTPAQLTQSRQRYKLTQRALADLLGTTESTVSRLECGTLPIDTRWASHLELVFDRLKRQQGAFI